MPCRSPYVTGTSVLAVTYKDGVLLASDTLGELQGFIWAVPSGQASALTPFLPACAYHSQASKQHICLTLLAAEFTMLICCFLPASSVRACLSATQVQ